MMTLKIFAFSSVLLLSCVSAVQAQVAAQQPDTVRRERVRGVQYASPEEAAAALAAEKRVPLWAGVSVSADLCGALMAACTPYGQYEAAARLNLR